MSTQSNEVDSLIYVNLKSVKYDNSQSMVSTIKPSLDKINVPHFYKHTLLETMLNIFAELGINQRVSEVLSVNGELLATTKMITLLFKYLFLVQGVVDNDNMYILLDTIMNYYNYERPSQVSLVNVLQNLELYKTADADFDNNQVLIDYILISQYVNSIIEESIKKNVKPITINIQ